MREIDGILRSKGTGNKDISGQTDEYGNKSSFSHFLWEMQETVWIEKMIKRYKMLRKRYFKSQAPNFKSQIQRIKA